MSERPNAVVDVSAENPEKRLAALNRERLQRVAESLTRRQRDFLDALPLLFHVNHPLLPGYVDAATPCGLAGYMPTTAGIKAARALSRSFELDRRSARRIDLRGLYMMGSPGTIAYSRNSDLDMWLVHDPALEHEALARLNDKARLLEAFAATLDLEVHFFVFDAERMRAGETQSLSAESSGSSQHFVLLDEFYRSGLLIAGLPPLWWRVPSQYDREYDAYTSTTIERRLVDPYAYIDFGAAPAIPPEEFFGAAVWQLYKSIDSPYKSVLKLLLMEAYSAEHPDIVLLATRFKQNVEADNVDLDDIDPYILMYTKVEEYLVARDEPERLDVLRRSFYLKANIALSDSRSRTRGDWRTGLMTRMVTGWGWPEERISRLDRRSEWRLDTALEERRDLTATLTASYATLSHFARSHASETKITEHDLNVLGRKLYAAFDRKPSKLEVITRGICPNPVETILSLHETRLANGRPGWLLYSGTVTPQEAEFRDPIRRAGSPAELVLWSELNRLADDATVWHVVASRSSLGAREVRRVREVIAQTLGGPAGNVAADALGQPRLARVAVLVNVGTDPFARADAAGDIRSSDLTDPLAFGGRRLNLVRSVDLMFMTTWNEYFAFRYEGASAVAEAVAELGQWLTGENALEALPEIEVNCLSSGQSMQIAERVENLMRDALGFLAQGRRDHTAHYVMQAERQLFHLELGSATPVLHCHEGQAGLMRALGGDGTSDHSVHFDRSCQRAGLLPLVYRHNRLGTLQVFACRRGPNADVYVVDERGALLVQRQECANMAMLLQHYQRFLDATLPRCADRHGAPPIELAQIVTSESRPPRVVTVDALELAGGYLPLRVFADADSEGHQHFAISVGEREFSTWEHGGSLFVQVAEFVQALREPGQTHPIYITDLDLSTRFRRSIGVTALCARDLLNYKKRIEYQLTRAMQPEEAAPAAAVGLAS